MRAHALLLVALRTCALEPLGLVRPLLHEPHGCADEHGELKELGLPVLHDGAPEVGASDVLPPGQRRALVRELLGVERVLTGERLGHERSQEENREEDGEPVLLEEHPHPDATATTIATIRPTATNPT